MQTRVETGFTIIETMLVLAITGLLVAGLFVGVGTSLSIQRYRDSAESFKALLQSQYGELTNIRNDRPDTWRCNPAGQSNSGNPEVRGQSDCVMVGRMVDIVGANVKLYTIVGIEINNPTPGNDIHVLRNNYTLRVSNVEIEQDSLDWGSEIGWPVSGTGSGGSTPRRLSILIVRSPESGQVYTFTSNNVYNNPSQAHIRNLIVANTGQGERLVCIRPADNAIVGERQGVLLTSYASSASAVEMVSNSFLQTSGRSSRC